MSADANFPAPAAPAVEKSNAAAPTAPAKPTTPTLVNTATNIPPASKTIDKNATAAIASGMATNAATNEKTAEAVQQGAGTSTTNSNTTATLGSYAMTPQQLVASGHLKPGTEAAVKLALDQGKSLEQAIPANAWTGKDGAANLANFVNNKNAQNGAVSTLIAKSESALVEKGVITGKESVAQTGGLVLAAATAGVGPVSDFVKNAAGATNAVSALTSKLPTGELSAVAGPVGNLIALGKQAAGLADKTLSGLPSTPGAEETPQGTAKGLFDKITSGFKALAAGKPQNLTAINAKNAIEKEAADAATPTVSPAEATQAAAASKTLAGLVPSGVADTLGKAFSAAQSGSIPGLNLSSGGIGGMVGSESALFAFAKQTGESLPPAPSGVSNLPGGADSIATTLQGNLPVSIPGTADIKNALSKVSGAATGDLSSVMGAVSGLKDKLGSNSNLASFASLGLNPNDLGKLQGSINSVSAGGPAEIKLPTTAEATNDVGGLIAQSKALLGNQVIPSLNFGGIKPKVLSPAENAEYEKLNKEKEALTDKQFDLQKTYRDMQAKYGKSSPEAEKAWADIQANQAAIDAVNQKLTNLSTSGDAGSSMPTNPTVPSPNPAPMPNPLMPAKPIMPTLPKIPGFPTSV